MNSAKEIIRLASNFGWQDLKANKDGVRVPQGSDGLRISFPEDSWDDEAHNEEGMGVWAEIRLQEIHAQMKKHKLRTIWEVGAGNGAVCIGLSKLGHEVIAVEPLYAGARYIASQRLVTFGSTLDELKLPNKSIPAIGAFDVLEHIENPVPMLNEFSRVLSKNGFLLITVPAHQFLFSEYDSSIGHFRRYSVSELRSQLSVAGFEIVSCRFLFSFLVPFAWVLRVLPEKIGLKNSATSRQSARTQFRIAQWLSAVFRSLVAIEKIFRLPFGLSILAVARPKVS
jgi:SAM-dependent methyltransferase